MTRFRAKEDRLARSRRAFVIVAALVAFVVAGAVGLMVLSRTVNPSVDDQMCPTTLEIPEDILLLVDATDPWSAVRRQSLANELSALSREIPRFARVSVFSIGASDFESTGAGGIGGAGAVDEPGQPLLVLCNPGSAAQVREGVAPWISWFVTNPELLAHRWDREFGAVIDSVLLKVGRSGSSDRSPIMETIRAASISVRNPVKLRVVLISDLYQNSDRFSVYGGQGLSQATPEAIADVAELGARALQGSSVHLYLLTPAAGEFLPRNDLISFWERFFQAQGARIEEIRRIEQ